MFPPQALTFLRGLARNNDRDWFNARKEIFETKLKAPMLALIESINAELMDFAPLHVTDPKKALYRIYRDTRFSADKTPYKTHLAAIFPRKGLDKHSSAGFYFHLTAKNIGVAAGSYMPGPVELLAVRTYLAQHHEKFRAAAKIPEKLMGKLEGSTTARMPKGFDAASPAADLIRMKQWLYWTELDVKLATSPKLCKELVKRFRIAAPVLEMLNAGLLKPH
ncbi:MAG: DUF2461 domain-containing protein [Acidobacteriota bacterium]